MDDLDLFDKDGNSISRGDVIYSVLKLLADKYNKDIEDIYLGFDNSVWNNYKAPSIYSVEVTDNGYDGNNVESFGDEDVLKINNI